MTRQQVMRGVLANVAFWGFIAFVVVTNGWALIGACLLAIVFVVFALGMGSR